MNEFENLQKDYICKMEELSNYWRTKGNEEKNSGNEFEYKKDMIRINIIEIYTKMFNVARKKSHNVRSFNKIYLDLLKEIYTPWEERLVKNKQFGMDEEYIIEETKIVTSNEIINIYKECYKIIEEI